MSEFEKPERQATSKVERNTRLAEIDEVAKEIRKQEAESRQAKTSRLRALRIEREKAGTCRRVPG
jgi:hypothetical protein